jgi:hypothetical protein
VLIARGGQGRAAAERIVASYDRRGGARATILAPLG